MKKKPSTTAKALPSVGEIVLATQPGGLGPVLDPLVVKALENIEASEADATRKAHANDWKLFTAWCRRVGLQAFPAEPQTVSLYITALDAGDAFPPTDDPRDRMHLPRKPATIVRQLATISVRHRDAGLASPTHHPAVKRTLKGIQRRRGVAPTKKTAAVGELTMRLADATPAGNDELMRLRNRAILLFGFGTASRRGEIAALDDRDLEWRTDGVLVTIRRSKVDQTGKGRTVRVVSDPGPWCPVAALRAWLDAAQKAGARSGPLFRSLSPRNYFARISGATISNVVKDAAAVLELDPKTFGGHSLRRGHLTSAAREGKKLQEIMRQAGHVKSDTTMSYIENQTSWDEASGHGLLSPKRRTDPESR